MNNFDEIPCGLQPPPLPLAMRGRATLPQILLDNEHLACTGMHPCVARTVSCLLKAPLTRSMDNLLWPSVAGSGAVVHVSFARRFLYTWYFFELSTHSLALCDPVNRGTQSHILEGRPISMQCHSLGL